MSLRVEQLCLNSTVIDTCTALETELIYFVIYSIWAYMDNCIHMFISMPKENLGINT